MGTTFPFTFDATFDDDDGERVLYAPPPQGPNPGPLEFTKAPNYTEQVRP